MINTYTPVKRSDRLSSQVAEQITQMILSGTLQPGDRLPAERELCETFQVSRTVVREAVSIVKAKGLIESNGRNGTCVRALQGQDVSQSIGMLITLQGHPATLEDLMEVRRALETQIARLAAERATDEEILKMQEILNCMAASEHDPNVYPDKDLEFHFALAKATHNPLFEILLNPLADLLLEGIRMASQLPGIAQEGYEYHCRILKMVIERDGKGASREMYAHLSQSQRVTSKAYKEIIKK
jgi:GntR family transcriptional repressor for pyruvate dehydrogenase complex